MGVKNTYVILLLILVIIISQIFAMILGIPKTPLIEGLDTSKCLPDCADVKYDYNNNTIPPCKALNVKTLKKADATTLGLPIINNFIFNINTYLNTQYNFDISINNILYNKNPPQKIINAYFTDFSGINYHTNQDILDNMANDPNFNTNLTAFAYTNPTQSQQNLPYPTPEIKANISNIIKTYTSDMLNPSQKLITIYTNFLQDMSGMCIETKQRCSKYYSDQNLITLINAEFEEPTYSGSSSSFHKISEYVYKAVNGTLGI